MQFTKQQLQEAYKKLPLDIRNVLGSEERSEAFQEIMQKFNLTVLEASKISEIAAPIICGLMLPQQFGGALRSAFPDLSEDKLKILAEEIDRALFVPIRKIFIQKTSAVPEVKPIGSVPLAVLQQPTPTLVVPQQNEIAKTKLEQSFRLPPQTATVSLNQSVPTQPAQAPKPIQHREVDPYREPIQ